MEKHNLNITDRIIDESMYSYTNETNLSLHDKILAYYNGLNWRIVPLNLFLSYPVIYDRYYKEDLEENSVTIAVCPFTLSASMFFGKYYPSEYLINSSLVLEDDKNNLLPIVTGYSLNPDGESKKVKRWEVFIKIFRNAISDYPDCQYIKLSINNHYNTLLDNDYYLNNNILFDNKNNNEYDVHPKTLIHVIQYKSSKNLEDKYSIILGRDSNPDEPTGYNVKDSGFSKYIEKMESKLGEKSAFIIPMLWFACKNLFVDAKIIKLVE